MWAFGLHGRFLFLSCDALEPIKFLRAEEFAKCDAETIAHPLDDHSTGILAFTEEYALDGSLWHTGNLAQFVGRDALFPSKLTDSVCYGFLSVHDVPPLSVAGHPSKSRKGTRKYAASGRQENCRSVRLRGFWVFHALPSTSGYMSKRQKIHCIPTAEFLFWSRIQGDFWRIATTILQTQIKDSDGRQLCDGISAAIPLVIWDNEVWEVMECN